MGALVDQLFARARGLGVDFLTLAEALRVEPGQPRQTVFYLLDGKERAAPTRWVLFNTASNIINACLPGAYPAEQVPGSVFKINMLFKRLPTPRDKSVSSRQAFSGTFHLNESYQQLRDSYRQSQAGGPDDMSVLPGEMYCHSLTDPSILSPQLGDRGYHTLTLFGLDVPYRWFGADNDRLREEITRRYLETINSFIREDIRDCLARNADGSLCVQAKTPLDLETDLGLPQGNIFHGNLSWPFAESEEEAGTWGVETHHENILICGSSAQRGGTVSGIPGHNAAMKVLGRKA
jgi:phytoene dehydrogenase-like protein